MSAIVCIRVIRDDRGYGLVQPYSFAAAFRRIANPPERLTDAYADNPEAMPPEQWNIEFGPAPARVLSATCMASSPNRHERKEDWDMRIVRSSMVPSVAALMGRWF
ncbi:hypothetical protein OK015_05320 [Mycobacterium sp. Aquia_216]|nr:hypothetical protein OK015_05320 [Mycobacterium sp. Aquia_216]